MKLKPYYEQPYSSIVGPSYLYWNLQKSIPHCCHTKFLYIYGSVERGKRDVDCDKQIEEAVTAPNCMLKGSWGEGGSGGIRKKLKSEYAAYLESNFRRNNESSI